MKLTIGVKILLGFGLALLIQCLVGLVAYRTVSRLVENSNQVNRTQETLTALASLFSLLKDVETGQRGYLLIEKESYLGPYRESLKEIPQKFDELKNLTRNNPTQENRLNALKPVIDQKLAELAKTIELNQQKMRDNALKIVESDQGKEDMDRIRQGIRAMEQEENHLLHQRSEDARNLSVLTMQVILGGTLLAFLLVGAVGMLVQRSITVPLASLMRFVETVGEGDLITKTTITTKDEVGSLGLALNDMVDGLRELSLQVRTATDNLNAAAAEILATAQEQAAASREQAAAVQEITTTLEEVNQSSNQISLKAREVATSAGSASSATKIGLQAAGDSVRCVESVRDQVETFAEHIVVLSEKTQAVGEIIAAVNDIAERSNLLALNAAIEAAGAGEHGNRFGVVATEMKNLADQAKELTNQVQSILVDIQKGISSSVMLTEEAVKRSEAGSQQAVTTETVIRQMADTTQESLQAFQQIIAGTGQQRIGFEQVTQGMKDIRQAAEQTALSTSQLESAVANVTTLSQQLTSSVKRYRL